jgi:SAM-dependent methyltransferase
MHKSNGQFAAYLNEYLKAYWLRPVTAAVRALESEVLDFSKYRGKSNLELACGDGVNGFVAMGGEIPMDFDVFQSMPVPSAEQFFGGKLDVYDSFKPELSRKIGSPRSDFWSKGIDHKQNLIDKAKLTGAYRDLECRDLNTGLNEGHEKYDMIFSNSIYWVKNIEPLLRDVQNAVRPGGKVILSIIKKSFVTQMAWTKLAPHKFRDVLDMGRHTHYQQLEEESVWESRFKTAGLKITQKNPTFNSMLAHMIELHDLREISPVTNLMAKKLSPKDLEEVKAKWIEYSAYLFNQMHSEGLFEATPENSHYNIYVLEK